MAIATVFTRGYGNGTFDGTVPLVLSRGYAVIAPAPVLLSTSDVYISLVSASAVEISKVTLDDVFVGKSTAKSVRIDNVSSEDVYIRQ